MRTLFLAFAFVSLGCSQAPAGNGAPSDQEIEQFFTQHRDQGNLPAALKRRSVGAVSYLATIHGFPNNLEACQDLIVPFNPKTPAATVSGSYFCEELR